ncbi:hypothetical protein BFW01_g2521 [Lasiodiplodia theobromae]|uniref:Uncharacterized protein n=2 Tax=Lasiodiplodia TaxID=66739 RepID=A0A5N5DQL6_9PEZI|nr:uncharacterized protein LTHEOB_5415 [Lasiodiplodia theobromae]KAB2579930.1 hypothetical protein DBV05_g1385 [Lasiodiplodia theobromae]KAF4545004.1 hypothetical protein LTHEOB_5415 [Lasiodiplodia theobromae]KAF9631659.1 hypothetical protein BFW01_g2521 [Lasiodiplodia theobromae]KAK0662905.1 hypothetical protein DIS24_g1625 [Lasiodiplodia hormozganensis]
MFQLPQRMALKRPRADDDDDVSIRHFEKKHRNDTACPPPPEHFFHTKTLSFSQNRANSPCLPALTPGHSDESGCDSPELPAYADTDMDDCMEDDYGALRSNPNSPAVPFMLPERLNPRQHQSDPSTGRIPTPIYGHFPPKITSNEPPSDIRTTTLEELRAASANARRSMAQRDVGRDMPSPIREDDMALTPTTLAGNRLSRLHFSGRGDSDGMDMDSPTFEPQRHLAAESKSGRARSGAITGKKKFHMGFREDCPKCLARVPGHNAHFLPS